MKAVTLRLNENLVIGIIKRTFGSDVEVKYKGVMEEGDGTFSHYVEVSDRLLYVEDFRGGIHFERSL